MKGEPKVIDIVKLCDLGRVCWSQEFQELAGGSDEVGEFASLGKTHGGACTSEAAERGPG